MFIHSYEGLNYFAQDVSRYQDAILETEEALLEAICFDFTVSSPHEILIDLFDQYRYGDNSESLRDVAWGIAHDS